MQPARPGGPALISLTRLRLASVRHLPGFAWHTARSALQARRTPGFLGLQLLADRRLTFWTATAWTDLAAMKRFHGAGAHRKAMPKLAAWCDEASVTRWAGEPGALGDWAGAHARMVEAGEPSAVRRPSAAHSAGAYAPPRLGRPLVLRLGARGRRPLEFTPAAPGGAPSCPATTRGRRYGPARRNAEPG